MCVTCFFLADIFRNLFTQSQLPVSTDEDEWAKDGEGNTTSTVEVYIQFITRNTNFRVSS